MEERLNWYQRICLELLWILCLVISIMPRLVRYYILKPIIGVLLVCLHYRYRVIFTNLRNSFPDKEIKEIKRIARKYYMFLAEVIIDIISLIGASEKRKDNAVNWVNAKEVCALTEGKDWIATGAHYGCWEYLPMWSRNQLGSSFMSVYHPLKNTVFDVFFLRLRRLSNNIVPVPMKSTFSYYFKNRNKGVILGLLSDQSPALTADTHWFRFLNQDTAFIDGSESIALKYKLPIYFAYTRRVAPGRYTVCMEEIYNGKDELPKHEITGRYARMLEKMILETPHLWMWSHNRWKHTPQKQIQLFGKSTLED